MILWTVFFSQKQLLWISTTRKERGTHCKNVSDHSRIWIERCYSYYRQLNLASFQELIQISMKVIPVGYFKNTPPTTPIKGIRFPLHMLLGKKKIHVCVFQEDSGTILYFIHSECDCTVWCWGKQWTHILHCQENRNSVLTRMEA